MVNKCPYCESNNIQKVPDSYNDGAYRECENNHTFHISDWS